MTLYQGIIAVSWAAFLLVWGISAYNVKRDIQGGGVADIWSRYVLFRIILLIALVFVAIRIATGTAHYSRAVTGFSQILFVPSVTLGWIAAFLTVIGIAIAIWARFYLGRNWSSHPAVKEGHELVTGGPYAFVRHPIYTGVMLAALGAALTGTIFGIFAIVCTSVLFLVRIKKEEAIMLTLFPDDYPAYQRRTKRLIPFLW